MPNTSLDDRIAAWRGNRVSGSLELAGEALGIVGAGVAAAGADWEAEAERLAAALREAKPEMAVVGAAVEALLALLAEAGASATGEAAGLAAAVATGLEERSLVSARAAGDLMPRNGVVATCSRSSSVVRACAAANRKAKAVRVVALYSKGHGKLLGDDLARLGVACDILPDASAADAVGWADAVLLGADAVAPEGVLNGTPSALLAAAGKGLLPIRVVCQTDKFSGGLKVAPGYDLVPMENIDEIITEEGVLTRAQALSRLA